jgi:hypothetical protein
VQPPEKPITLEDLDRAPTNLPVTINVDFHKMYLELMERFTTTSDELFEIKEELINLKSERGTRRLLDELIIPYASRAFWFMCVYCAVVALVVVADALHHGFSLPDSVLDWLVGSTAVTVIGLVGMVLTGVFLGGQSK